MKNIKLTILTLGITLSAMPQLFSQTTTSTPNKKWNAALSMLVLNLETDGMQLEFERKFERISVGAYLQGFLGSLDDPQKYEWNYLPHGGLTNANSRSLQTGLQISVPFYFLRRPESKWNFWFKGRAGISISKHHNLAGGPYWKWDENEKKEYYMITSGESKTFSNFETGLAIGVSRRIFKSLSFFAEPAANLQFVPYDYRVGQKAFHIGAFLMLHYGVRLAF